VEKRLTLAAAAALLAVIGLLPLLTMLIKASLWAEPSA
jgi:hypothetical protein